MSKCNLATQLHASELDLPRYRPISPITFASATRSRTSSDSANEDSDEQGEYDDDGDDSDGMSSLGSFEYSYGGNGKRPVTAGSSKSQGHSLRPSLSNSEVRSQMQQQEDRAAEAARLSARYTLMTFSTGQILEDDFLMSWYHLRPYELLELHPAGALITLPREIMVDYIQPYFEAKVKSLRVLWREPQGFYEGRLHKTARERAHTTGLATPDTIARQRARERERSTSRDRQTKGRKTKLEWRERWLVIHQGVLSLAKHRKVSGILVE